MPTLKQDGDGRVFHLLHSGLFPSGHALGFAMDISDLLHFEFLVRFIQKVGSNQSGYKKQGQTPKNQTIRYYFNKKNCNSQKHWNKKKYWEFWKNYAWVVQPVKQRYWFDFCSWNPILLLISKISIVPSRDFYM